MSAQPQVPLELVRFNLTSEEIALFQEHKAEWQAANRADRRKIASQVYEDLKKNNPVWTEADRKLKKEVGSITHMRIRG